MPSLRTLLVLGRVSNLPTVWSNCLAAWLLSGGGPWGRFVQLCAGATLLYVAGMYLNDAFDANFDRQHRPERPIPSGAIRERLVWQIGLGLLVAGFLCLELLGRWTPLWALFLCGCIVLYDAVHKLLAVSPLLMALCRFLLILTAASAGVEGITGLAVWTGLVLGSYIVGLSYVARRESTAGPLRYWPLLLLAAPLLLAAIVNDGRHRQPALLLCVVSGLWVVRCLRNLWGVQPPNLGRAVSGLLAGIVWVDWLSVANQPRVFGTVFIALFLLALGLQRQVPAT